MEVLVYVLGSARSVPLNYPSLELNWAKLDSGGRGFVTELSQPARELRSVRLDGERLVEDADAEAATLLALRGQSYGDSKALIDELVQHYGSFEGFRAAVVAGGSTLSERGTLGAYVDCALRYERERAEAERTDNALAPGGCRMPEGIEASEEVVFREIEAGIVKPLQDLQSLFDSSAWLTRLYMTVSPADMTVDPLFGLNPRLPAVSNVQTARLDLDCGPDHWYFDAPTRIQLPNGGVLRSVGGKWPAAASALPANAVVRQHGTTGYGSLLQDNTPQIDDVLEYPEGGFCGMALASPRREAHGLLSSIVTLALGALVTERRRRRARRDPDGA